MTLIDTIRALSTSNLTVTACEIAEGRMEIYTKADDSGTYDEMLSADQKIGAVMTADGWAFDRAGAMAPGYYQIWTR